MADQLIYTSIRTDQDTQRLSVPTRIGVRITRRTSLAPLELASLDEGGNTQVIWRCGKVLLGQRHDYCAAWTQVQGALLYDPTRRALRAGEIHIAVGAMRGHGREPAPNALIQSLRDRVYELRPLPLPERGLDMRRTGGEREYAAAVDGADVELMLLSAGEIPRELAAGRIHLGVTGSDLVQERIPAWDHAVEIVSPMGFGHADLAYSILFRTTYPGWFYSIEQGATTMWERWNSYSKAEGFGKASMNSFNHYAYGAIGEWMYESVAGLQAVEPGYKRIRFSPQPGSQLDHAEATLETPYGTASSAWKRSDGKIRYTITVPPNTTGEFTIGDGAPKILQPGSYSFAVE